MKRSGRIQERRRARSKLGPHYSELFDEVADLLDQERSTSRTFSVAQQALPVVGEEQTQQPSSASMETPGRAIDECAGCHEEVKRNPTIYAVDQRRATRTLPTPNPNRGDTGSECTSPSQSIRNKRNVSSAQDYRQIPHVGEKGLDSRTNSEKQYRRVQEYGATHFATQCHPALRIAEEIPKRRHHPKRSGAVGPGGLRYHANTYPTPRDRVRICVLSSATGRPEAASGDEFDAPQRGMGTESQALCWTALAWTSSSSLSTRPSGCRSGKMTSSDMRRMESRVEIDSVKIC